MISRVPSPHLGRLLCKDRTTALSVIIHYFRGEFRLSLAGKNASQMKMFDAGKHIYCRARRKTEVRRSGPCSLPTTKELKLAILGLLDCLR